MNETEIRLQLAFLFGLDSSPETQLAYDPAYESTLITFIESLPEDLDPLELVAQINKKVEADHASASTPLEIFNATLTVWSLYGLAQELLDNIPTSSRCQVLPFVLG